MKRNRRIATVAGLVSLAAMGSLAAQDVPVIQPGARVRLSTHSRPPTLPITGRVVDATDDVLRVERDGDGEILDVFVSSIERLEVSQGKGSRRTGALRGLLIMGGIGAAIGFVAGEDCASSNDWICFDRGDTALMGGALFGAVGMGLGALFSGGERWEEVDARPVRLGVSALPGGKLGLGARIRW